MAAPGTGGRPSALTGKPRFVAVAVAAEAGAGSAEPIEIVLRNGRILRMRLTQAKACMVEEA
jgi:hypothetical protein